jgi:hypothetical protein
VGAAQILASEIDFKLESLGRVNITSSRVLNIEYITNWNPRISNCPSLRLVESTLSLW